ncbi:MAG TPA: aldose epimerase family protein [Candidatus Cybelea sp.]|nr:aldose epimerase family protein [Candidatus Cybelea sp.]
MTLFGEVEGKPVQEVRLKSAAGAEASIIGFGAALRDLTVPLRGGRNRRVVIGYETLEGYRNSHGSAGATCGRVANRIANGRFSLDGKSYQLALNENGRTHLHGGMRGFAHRLWDVVESQNDSVVLRLISPDGEENYPGTVEALCTYRLLEPATIRIEMQATTDAPTLVNLVNHSYFTLAENVEIWDHKLQIAAEFYTPLDAALIPTGEIITVAGTAYDFRSLRPIRLMQAGRLFNYDINFVLDNLAPLGSSGDVAARVISPTEDLTLEVATSEPGLQLYTGAVLSSGAPGVAGQRHFAHAGLCLETQRFPDAIHRRHFPQATLRPGETYRHVVEYRFKPAP